MNTSIFGLFIYLYIFLIEISDYQNFDKRKQLFKNFCEYLLT